MVMLDWTWYIMFPAVVFMTAVWYWFGVKKWEKRKKEKNGDEVC